MDQSGNPIEENRPLAHAEYALIRWLLENGIEGAKDFIPQLDQARVVARCPCGCASIDLSISGRRPAKDSPLVVLSDYSWHDAEGRFFGVYVFAKGGLLAGLDLWSIDGCGTPDSLPIPEQLIPL